VDSFQKIHLRSIQLEVADPSISSGTAQTSLGIHVALKKQPV
jgi:hypothetical protein